MIAKASSSSCSNSSDTDFLSGLTLNSSPVISGAFAQCALRSPTGAAALEDPTAPQNIVFASEPEQEEDRELLRRAVEVLRPQRVTIIVTERPFAPAIAASRGEQPRDVEAWLEELGKLRCRAPTQASRASRYFLHGLHPLRCCGGTGGGSVGRQG